MPGEYCMLYLFRCPECALHCISLCGSSQLTFQPTTTTTTTTTIKIKENPTKYYNAQSNEYYKDNVDRIYFLFIAWFYTRITSSPWTPFFFMFTNPINMEEFSDGLYSIFCKLSGVTADLLLFHLRSHSHKKKHNNNITHSEWTTTTKYKIYIFALEFRVFKTFFYFVHSIFSSFCFFFIFFEFSLYFLLLLL